MDPARNNLSGELIVIIVLTMINAFFAAAEIAFVLINKSKMNQLAKEGNKKAITVLRLLEKSDDFLATIQVAITFAGFLSSAQAATSFALIFADLLPDFAGAKTVATLIVTLILSYFMLVFGELFPKKVAMQMPETIAMGTSRMIYFTQMAFRPFVWLLSASIGVLQKIVPIDFSETEEKFTREEMQMILDQSRRSDSFDSDEVDMMEGVLSLDTKLARDVMVPRTDTVMINIDDVDQNILHLIVNSPYSRIPVYKNQKDNIIGILHVKHLLRHAALNGFDEIDLNDIMHPPMMVPETIYMDDLLIQFQHTQQHMAIIIDEYGGVEGIVTMEDLIEEIVGDIDDETDIESIDEIQFIDESNYYLSGSLTLDDFNDYFDEEFESSEVDTIAGYVIHHLGHVPDKDKAVSLRLKDYVFTTKKIANGRILGLLLQIDKDHQIKADYVIEDEVTA